MCKWRGITITFTLVAGLVGSLGGLDFSCCAGWDPPRANSVVLEGVAGHSGDECCTGW